MKRATALTFAIILVMTAVSVHAEQNVSQAQPIIARIGLLTPLTGALESFGQGWLNAATLAIEDLNELNTTFQFELVVEDTKTSTNGVRDAMQALIVENVSVVVGAAASFVTLAAIEMARDNQIPMISYASTTRTNQCRR